MGDLRLVGYGHQDEGVLSLLHPVGGVAPEEGQVVTGLIPGQFGVRVAARGKDPLAVVSEVQ